MAKINSRINTTNTKINIQKNTINNKLENTIKSNTNGGIKSASISKIKDVNFSRAVGTSRVTLKKINHKDYLSNSFEKDTRNNSVNSVTALKSGTSRANQKIRQTVSGIKTGRRIVKDSTKTSRTIIHKSEANERKLKKVPNSKIKTIKKNYLSNSIEEDDDTKNNGVNSVTALKRGVSRTDHKIRQTVSGIKTGKRIVKSSIKTGKSVVRKAQLTKIKIKRIATGKMKITKKIIAHNVSNSIIKSGKSIVSSTGKSINKSGEILYKNTKEEIKTGIQTDKNNDLVIQGIVDTTNNTHTMFEIGKRTNNLRIKINNHYKNKNNDKEYNKIQTKKNNKINTKTEGNIHTKNTNEKIKTKNNKKYDKKIKEKRVKDIRDKRRIREISEKIYKEAEIVIKKLAESLTKSKIAIGIAIGLGIILVISLLSSISGVLNIGIGCIPNIDNPEKWRTEMNRIEAEANRTISSADKFRVKGNSNADWRDIIAVYMAKYENDPPENFGTGSNVSGSGSITVGSGTETTFTGTYSDIIKVASEKHGVDPNLIAAVIKQESDFNPNEVSSAGAMGLMQLMPENVAEYGVSNPFDPYQNIMGGTQELQELCELYNNDLVLVLIGYNWGMGNVHRHGVTSSNYASIVPAETRNYVPIVLANYEAYKNGTPLPNDSITGIVDSTGNNNELSKIYYLFNTLEVSKSTKTVTHKDGSKSKKTVKTVTLQKHDTEYVMKKLNFTEDQKEMVKAMLEADAFKEVLSDFDFKFKIRGANSNTGNVDIGTGESIGTGIAATDEQFKEITKHIEECLGTPYVMGGTQPGVALDCSAFVSYVFTQTGTINGRYTAQGLCDISKKVDENELKPGDLIFFQGTYDCPDAVTHVGIYVGNGMMAHSGNPCKYASFNTAYWQEHLYGYGRLL
ncbi:transglycosylase SLT domain-containing protein [Clostridium sp. VAP23]|uniref:bifunctional lytic transglycosylase/C40 family peptidase n=1 Tax=Clostridium sp. VAP23 TaxID=2949981 RepID=UPI00207991AB|nr:transglycosylase SLT domain-containing protein [Clostridium sp. VAP23]